MSILNKPSISTEMARDVILRAEARATEIGVPVSIAVADESGVLKALSKMDGTLVASVRTAETKARSAAWTGLGGDQWKGLADGDPDGLGYGLTVIHGVAPLGGGLPITVDGAVIGAIGVAGGMVDQDMDIATTALQGLS
jgi:uncharacterized protein GlcG (DUF336 family)